MSLRLQPVRVGNGYDEDGLLVFVEDRLVAVLVRLSDQHEDRAGRWFLETGYGRLDGPSHPTFTDIQAAQSYIVTQLSPSPRQETGPFEPRT